MAQQVSNIDPNVWKGVLAGADLTSDHYRAIGSQIGRPDLPSGTEFEYQGNVYRVSDTGSGTRRVSSLGSVTDIESKRIQDQAQKSLQQGISTLEGGKATIAPIYQSRQEMLRGELGPTQQRYENLLAQVTARQQEEMGLTTKTQSRELGRRGITGGSGLYDQTLEQALSPISRHYAGQVKDVGLSQEADLRAIQNAITELTNQQATQELGITKDIANIQASGGMNAAQLAAQMMTSRQAAAENQAEMALRQLLAEQQAGFTERELAMQEAQSPLQLQLLQAQLDKALAPATGGSGYAATNYLAPSAQTNTSNQAILQQIFGNLGTPQTSAPSATLNYQGF